MSFLLIFSFSQHVHAIEFEKKTKDSTTSEEDSGTALPSGDSHGVSSAYFLSETSHETYEYVHPSSSDGEWSEMKKCAVNSGVRTFAFWEIKNSRGSKARITCNGITNKGSYDGEPDTKGWYFNTGDSATKKKIQLSENQLPIGMVLKSWNACGAIDNFAFLYSNAASVYASKYLSDDYDDYYFGFIGDMMGLDYPTCYSSSAESDYAYHQCDPGYVVTGIKLKSRDVNFPNKGKRILGVIIRCTELLKGGTLY